MGYVNARINAGHEHIIKSHDSKSTLTVWVGSHDKLLTKQK